MLVRPFGACSGVNQVVGYIGPLTAFASDEHLEAAQEVMDRLLARGKLDRGEESYLDALSDLVASYEDQKSGG